MLSYSSRMTSSPGTVWPAANWASLRSSASSHPAGAWARFDMSSMGETIGVKCGAFQSKGRNDPELC
jgi:hypothetical protein